MFKTHKKDGYAEYKEIGEYPNMSFWTSRSSEGAEILLMW